VPQNSHPWHLRINEYLYLKHDDALSAATGQLKLAPYETQEIDLVSGKTANAPEGYRPFGQIELKKSDLDEIRIPVEF
jgi:hypothetical protein